MGASHIWQTTGTPVSLELYRVYGLCVRIFNWIATFIYAVYLWSLGLVCEGAITDVVYYDFNAGRKTTVMCNSNVFMILHMLFLKFLVRCNIDYILEVPWHQQTERGVYELALFQNGKWIRKLSRSLYSGMNFTDDCPKGTYLMVMLDGKYAITALINEFYASFNANTSMTTAEVAAFANLRYGRYSKGKKIYLIQDETLDESSFLDDALFILSS